LSTDAAVEVAPDEFAWASTEGPAALVESVRRRCRGADGHDPLDEAAALRLKHHGLEGDSRLWVAGADGFAFRHGPAVDLAVAPESRGRGHGAALAAAAAADPASLRAWSHGDHPAAANLAAAHGFDRARELWVMRRRAAAPLPQHPVPDGIKVRPYRDSDAAELLRVNAAAFAHHVEQASMDAEELAERMAEPWFDPAGLLLADAGDRLLGFHWTKQHSAELGEVYVLGIDPAAQGMKLGKVLTVAGLEHLAAKGVAEVMLYTDADNTAAVALYAHLGFTHAHEDTHVQYARR
jgi:mycothiol synthase